MGPLVLMAPPSAFAASGLAGGETSGRCATAAALDRARATSARKRDERLRMDSSRSLGRRDIDILADLLGHELVDLSMAGNGGRLLGTAVDVDRVIAAFPQELAAMLLQMADEV